MPTITAIIEQPARGRDDRGGGRRHRAAIVVDGRRKTSLSMVAVRRLGLTPGHVWDETLAGQVADEAEYEIWLRKASRWVNRRALSRAQVADKLAAAGCTQPLAHRVLERMQELKMIDDAALGQAFLDGLQTGKPAGQAMVREKLLKRGLDETLAAEIADRAATDSRAKAVEWARKKLVSMPVNVVPGARRRRILAALARRGFDEDTAHWVLAQVGLEEDGE